MALSDCLLKMDKAGLISPARKTKIEKEVDRLENIYRSQGKADARTKAEFDAVNKAVRDVEAEQIALTREAKVVKELESKISAAKDPAKALRNELVSIDSGVTSLENIYRGVHGLSTRKLFDFVEDFRSKIPGGLDTVLRVSKEKSRNLVRGLFGEEQVPSLYTRYAKEYTAARESLLDSLENHGIKINRLTDYKAQMTYDNIKVLSSNEDDFVNFMFNKIDRSKMFDEFGRPLDNDGIKRLLKELREEMVLEARTGRKTRIIGSTAAADAQLHRVLHYKDSKSYLSVFEKYGSGNIFDNLMEQLDSLAMDVALVKKFGPRPQRTFDKLDTMTRARSGKPTNNIILDNRNIFNTASGRTAGVVNPKTAATSSTFRNLVSGARLHSAVLSAVQDQAHIKSVARVWGLNYSKILGKELRALLLPTGGKKLRSTATRLSHAVDWSHGIESAVSRHSDVAIVGSTSRIAAGVADFTIRASGLARLTNYSKMATYVELLQAVSAQSSKTWDKLPAPVRNGLDANGISRSDWDIARAKTTTVDGVKYLDFDEIEPRVAEKFIGAMAHEERLAVPEPGLEARAIMTGGAAAGTAARELRAWTTQFLGFTISATLANLRRILFHPSNVGHLSKAKYMAHLTIYMTLAGMLTVQLKDLSKGKEAREFTDPSLMMDAIAAAGLYGLSNIGSLSPEELEKSTTVSAMYGITPPVLRMLLDLGTSSSQALGKALQGEGKKSLYPLINFSAQNIPPKLFYTELLMQRYIWDQLLKMADPQKAARAFKRKESNLKRRTGQKFKVRPGKTNFKDILE